MDDLVESQPFEMSQKILHWRVALKAIREKCVKLDGIVLERDIVKHFVLNGLKSHDRTTQENKVKVAIQGLVSSGYCKRCLGTTETGFGVCLQLIKLPSREVVSDE